MGGLSEDDGFARSGMKVNEEPKSGESNHDRQHRTVDLPEVPS